MEARGVSFGTRMAVCMASTSFARYRPAPAWTAMPQEAGSYGRDSTGPAMSELAREASTGVRMAASGLSLLTCNIGNPSEERARRQLAWLAERDERVLVLTETKASSGCQFECDFNRALVTEHGFIDAYRHLHPDEVEHSWVGRTGDGYRYDHAFCSAILGAAITDCAYVHRPREDQLSDHSALTARLNLEPLPALPVSDLAAAITPGMLF
jgi:hypothetical protein